MRLSILIGLLLCPLLLISEAAAGSMSDNPSAVWFSSSPLKGEDIVAGHDAVAFAERLYTILDAKLFDPSFKAEERGRQRAELEAALAARPTWTRSEVVDLVNERLRRLGISHLRILDPIQGAAMAALAEQPPSAEHDAARAAEPAVSAEVRDGAVGVLRLRSFFVPQITKAAVDRARARLAGARAIVVDVRGNGGGAGSPISYVIEHLLGPDRVISFDRTREGLHRSRPYVVRGYFEDAENTGAQAEIRLSEREPYIEWRTRPDAVKDPRPHVVLVNQECGSACEVFAAAAKENGVPVLGVRTYGAVLGAGVFKLPWPGYALIVPVLGTLSPMGRIHEGVGVAPDVEIPECHDRPEECLTRAVEIAARINRS
ncbi:MAG: S41 family peptidase [Pseudomonadota bacterium]